MEEFLIPGVQNRQKPDSRTEVSWVGGDGEQSLRDRAEQHAVERARILERQSRELSRQREYQMTIGDGQQIPALDGEPLLPSCRLALRTMPIPA